MLRNGLRVTASCARRGVDARCGQCLSRLSTGAKGGGGGGDDDDDDEFADLFSLEEKDDPQTKATEARPDDRAREDDLRARAEAGKEPDAAYDAGRQKAQDELRSSKAIIEKLVSVTANKVKARLTLASRYTAITRHTLEVLQHSTIRTASVHAYDAEQERHPFTRRAAVLYDLANCSLSAKARYALRMLATEKRFDARTQHVRVATTRYAHVEENQLYAVYLLDQLVLAARRAVGEEVAPEQQKALTGWEEVLTATSALNQPSALQDYLRAEYDHVSSEHQRRLQLYREHRTQSQFWHTKEGIHEALDRSKQWKADMEARQQRLVRRLPRNFVERLSGRFMPRDLIL